MGDNGQKTMSIRLNVDALESAKIAAAYRGKTVMEYVSEMVLEGANRDIEESHRARSIPPKARAKKAEA